MSLRPDLKCVVCGVRQARAEFIPATSSDSRRRYWCAGCRRADRKRHPAVPKALRRDLWARSAGLCSYCDVKLDPAKRWDVDHVVGLFHGGAHALSNMVVSCARCNCATLSFYPAITYRSKRESTALAAQAGLVDRNTFWEKRAFVQIKRAGWAGVDPATRPGRSPYDEVRSRVAHLSEDLLRLPESVRWLVEAI